MSDVIGTLFHKEIPYGGVKGDKGDTGATPNVSATASVDSSTGTPSVNVVKTGTAENPSFEFAFSNLKGEKGDPGSGSSVSWGEIDGDITDQTDLMDELDDKTDNSVVGTVESGATASKAYAVGEHFIRDGAFCTAIAAIAEGAAFTLNTNYTAGDIAEAILADQTYDGTSVKAQSGKAVNEALLTKFDAFSMNANHTYTITFTATFIGLLCMSHTSAGRMDIFFVRASEALAPVVLHLSSSTFYTVTTATGKLIISHSTGTIRTDIIAFQGMGNYTITSVANS